METTDSSSAKFRYRDIYLHPKRTLASLYKGAEDAARLHDLEGKLADVSGQIDNLVAEKNEALIQKREIQDKLNKTLVTVEMLVGNVKKLRIELDEKRDLENQLESFMRQLEQVENLKRQYDQRIKRLKDRLNNALAANNNTELSELEEPLPINLTDSSSDSSDTYHSTDNPDDDDWLQHLED